MVDARTDPDNVNPVTEMVSIWGKIVAPAAVAFAAKAKQAFGATMVFENVTAQVVVAAAPIVMTPDWLSPAIVPFVPVPHAPLAIVGDPVAVTNCPLILTPPFWSSVIAAVTPTSNKRLPPERPAKILCEPDCAKVNACALELLPMTNRTTEFVVSHTENKKLLLPQPLGVTPTPTQFEADVMTGVTRLLLPMEAPPRARDAPVATPMFGVIIWQLVTRQIAPEPLGDSAVMPLSLGSPVVPSNEERFPDTTGAVGMTEFMIS